MKRAVLYLRVSTVDQTTANQERELRAIAERSGWEITKAGSMTPGAFFPPTRKKRASASLRSFAPSTARSVSRFYNASTSRRC
jgi:hypothetical protein